MKKNLIFVLLLLISFNLKSQQDDPVKETLTIVKKLKEKFDNEDIEKKKKEEEAKNKFVIEITYPFEGKSFNKGETVSVIWGYENPKDKYEDIQLYLQVTTNYGFNWTTVDSVKLKDKKKDWTISFDETKLCQLRLTNNINYNIFKDTLDESKFDFRSGVIEIKKSNGSNFAIVSAIKSIAGVKPSFEFIDINFNFKMFDWLSTLAGIDVAMTDDTSNNESKKKISEAGVFINLTPSGFRFENRAFNVGPFVKIFNTVPYYGLQLGSMEIGGALESSYLIVGFARRMFKPDIYKDTINTSPEEFQDNIYIEFGLYSEKLGIPLKYLRIKGGILIPAWYTKGFDRIKTKDIISRVALEIPLGGLFKF